MDEIISDLLTDIKNIYENIYIKRVFDSIIIYILDVDDKKNDHSLILEELMEEENLNIDNINLSDISDVQFIISNTLYKVINHLIDCEINIIYVIPNYVIHKYNLD